MKELIVVAQSLLASFCACMKDNQSLFARILGIVKQAWEAALEDAETDKPRPVWDAVKSQFVLSAVTAGYTQEYASRILDDCADALGVFGEVKSKSPRKPFEISATSYVAFVRFYDQEIGKGVAPSKATLQGIAKLALRLSKDGDAIKAIRQEADALTKPTAKPTAKPVKPGKVIPMPAPAPVAKAA